MTWIVFIHGLKQLWLAFDQFLNVLLFPFSEETWADETFSSKCGRLQHRNPYKYYAKFVNFLFYFQANDFNHCRRAYENELRREHLPPQMRNIMKDDHDN